MLVWPRGNKPFDHFRADRSAKRSLVSIQVSKAQAQMHTKVEITVFRNKMLNEVYIAVRHRREKRSIKTRTHIHNITPTEHDAYGVYATAKQPKQNKMQKREKKKMIIILRHTKLDKEIFLRCIAQSSHFILPFVYSAWT